jgi:hypothetical protein
MDAQALDIEFAKQFWTTANLVVSFSVAQITAFGLTAAAASKDQNSGLIAQIKNNYTVAMSVAVLSAAISLGLVGFCEFAAWQIMTTLCKSAVTARNLVIFDVMRLGATLFTGAGSIWLVRSIKHPKEAQSKATSGFDEPSGKPTSLARSPPPRVSAPPAPRPSRRSGAKRRGRRWRSPPPEAAGTRC